MSGFSLVSTHVAMLVLMFPQGKLTSRPETERAGFHKLMVDSAVKPAALEEVHNRLSANFGNEGSSDGQSFVPDEVEDAPEREKPAKQSNMSRGVRESVKGAVKEYIHSNKEYKAPECMKDLIELMTNMKMVRADGTLRFFFAETTLNSAFESKYSWDPLYKRRLEYLAGVRRSDTASPENDFDHLRRTPLAFLFLICGARYGVDSMDLMVIGAQEILKDGIELCDKDDESPGMFCQMHPKMRVLKEYADLGGYEKMMAAKADLFYWDSVDVRGFNKMELDPGVKADGLFKGVEWPTFEKDVKESQKKAERSSRSQS